jgi:SnoaL-like domain
MQNSKTERWVEAYQAAWNTNEPQAIGALFNSQAEYRTSPFAEPWVGVQSITEQWLARKDTPGSWTFRFEILVETADTGIVRGWTDYLDPKRSFSNLWVIRFDPEGRATSFTEWFMLAP